MVHFEITLASFQRKAATLAKHDDVVIVGGRDRKGRRRQPDPAARRSAPRPACRPALLGLLGEGRVDGTTTVGGHESAFHRLERDPHNANDWYVVAVDRQPIGSFVANVGWAPLGMAAAALALLILGAIAARGSRRALEETERTRAAQAASTAAERDYHETQREFTEIMQVTRDEEEAYGLLKRHLRALACRAATSSCSTATAATTASSRDRARPSSPLARRSASAEPRACLAVRLGKKHERGEGAEPLLDVRALRQGAGTRPASPRSSAAR